jgi:hypothetical protein
MLKDERIVKFCPEVVPSPLKFTQAFTPAGELLKVAEVK